MSLREINVLLIEDNPGDARLVRESLASIKSINYTVESVDRLAAAIERLRRPDFDIVLLDLSLPDSEGFDGVAAVARAAPQTPIVALSGLSDSDVIQDAVKKGVEDYIVKGSFSGDLLARSIQYSIDRRRTREELAEARDSALESARLRSEFLANMSHEIRTPLNAIVGMTRLLMDTRLTNDQREMLEISRQSTDSLLKIINDVLDFSKISAGKVDLEDADFDLGAALESVIAMFAGQARSKQVELASYIEGDVPVLLRGDAARLRQVITNLIGNAVKFTPTGQVTARVAQISDIDDEVVLRFAVRDTGIGIPLEGQRHLFQAFSQADSSTTRKYGGSGLGLAISAQLIELMGGNIGVQSEPGNGSTFWFTAAFRKQPVASGALPAGARLNGLSILVADASSAVCNIVREHVGAWGMRCAAANTAAEAMAELKNAAVAGTPYDITLLELRPGAEGLAICGSIKADPLLARTRVLGMYALGSRPDERRMKEAGIRGLLVKPIKQSQLFSVLHLAMAAPADLADRGPATYRRRLSEIESRLPGEVRARTRVLLVEDNVVNQQVQLRLLERMGYRANTVNNGREALECVRGADYDIILMDCQMPEMDGYTATSELRRLERDGRHPVIIGVTAHALPGDREECLAAGMDDYISKPIVPEELAAVLEKWVVGMNPALSSDSAGASHACAGILDENVVATLREIQRPGEGDFLAHLLGIFLADLNQRTDDMRAMLLSHNSSAIANSAHALKGAAGQVGAVRVREICKKIEAAAKADIMEDLGAMLDDLARQAMLLQRTFKPDDASAEGHVSRGS